METKNLPSDFFHESTGFLIHTLSYFHMGMVKGLESSGIGRKLLKVAELQRSNLEGLQSQFRNFF
jgi:hypothetical protein